MPKMAQSSKQNDKQKKSRSLKKPKRKDNKNKKQLNGGAFLGQGSFGCVFSPSIACEGEGKGEEGAVSKVFSSMKEAKSEYALAKKITNIIDPDGDFTNPAVSLCYMDEEDKYEHNYKECDFMRSQTVFLKQILYKYKGVDLYAYVKKRPISLSIFEGFLNLIEGLVVFDKKKMVHSDIKMENILIVQDKNDPKLNQKMVFIDFGLTKSYNIIYDYPANNDRLTYQYFVHPPEFIVYHFILEHVARYNDLNNIDMTKIVTMGIDLPRYTQARKWFYAYMKTPNNISKEHYFECMYENGNEMELQFNDFCVEILQMIKDKVNNERYNDSIADKYLIIKKMFEEFIPKVDTFALGLAMSEAFTYTKALYNIDTNNTAITLFKEILKNTTHFNVLKRWTIRETRRKYKAFLKNLKESSGIKTTKKTSVQLKRDMRPGDPFFTDYLLRNIKSPNILKSVINTTLNDRTIYKPTYYPSSTVVGVEKTTRRPVSKSTKPFTRTRITTYKTRPRISSSSTKASSSGDVEMLYRESEYPVKKTTEDKNKSKTKAKRTFTTRMMGMLPKITMK